MMESAKVYFKMYPESFIYPISFGMSGSKHITRKEVEEYFNELEVANPIDENAISRSIINKFMEDDELEGKALRSQKDIDENTMLVTDLSTIQKCMIEYGKQILCGNVNSKR